MTAIVILVFVALYLFGGSALAMLAWNFAIVPLFHAPAVSFWQTFAILFLLGIVMRALRGDK